MIQKNGTSPAVAQPAVTNDLLQQQPANQQVVPAQQANTDVATTTQKLLSPSERFAMAVEREFSASAGGDIALTGFQKKLCQNYFLKIDMMLKDTEKKRLAKPEKYREPLPLDWSNVNIPKLAVDVIIFSSIGLDPMQPNHINVIPYKNSATNKYDLGFIMGYRGIELKAKKYGYDVPNEIVVELVYAKDHFKQIKKDTNTPIENYEFKVINSFDRGELVGGFYYFDYTDNPKKNKIRVFTKADIDKRKPSTASPEFWGGTKDKWENGQKNGTVDVAGWYDEMAYKTICRAAYNAITIDSEKIDANYLKVIQAERDTLDNKVIAEIAAKANKKSIGFDDALVDESTGEIMDPTPEPPAQTETPKQDPPAVNAGAQVVQPSLNGPGF